MGGFDLCHFDLCKFGWVWSSLMKAFAVSGVFSELPEENFLAKGRLVCATVTTGVSRRVQPATSERSSNNGSS